MNLLGLDLSDVPSKNYNHPEVFIIPGLYIVTSLLNMKITMATADKNKKEKEEKTKLSPEENAKLAEEKQLIKKESEEADAMESMNKSMRYMMPIMTVSIALIAPLGLKVPSVYPLMIPLSAKVFTYTSPQCPGTSLNCAA